MLKILKKVLTGLIVGVLALVVILAILVYAITYHPADVQAADLVCPADAPELKPGQELKVLNWNVQYMGSKQYVFWYDVPAGDGPDLRPAPEAIEATFQEVARVAGVDRAGPPAARHEHVRVHAQVHRVPQSRTSRIVGRP